MLFLFSLLGELLHFANFKCVSCGCVRVCVRACVCRLMLKNSTYFLPECCELSLCPVYKGVTNKVMFLVSLIVCALFQMCFDVVVHEGLVRAAQHPLSSGCQRVSSCAHSCRNLICWFAFISRSRSSSPFTW